MARRPGPTRPARRATSAAPTVASLHTDAPAQARAEAVGANRELLAPPAASTTRRADGGHRRPRRWTRWLPRMTRGRVLAMVAVSLGVLYRHGYFDAVEREFRGFAAVEQSDTEAFADYATGVKASGGTQDTTPELFQPPVVTRSWFHTGAFPDNVDLGIALRAEFFQQRQDLPDTEFPPGLSTTEYRACVRALKRSLLRTETYSPDGSADAAKPYSVTEHRFAVRRVQAGVVQPVGIESLTTQYERDVTDLRVIHAMVLDTDKFGHPTATASIAYGRRISDPSLPADVTADQRRTWVTAQRTTEAPEIDRSAPVPAYRLPAACETRSWELTGVTPAGPRFTREEIDAALASATDVEYSADPAPGVASRRLIGWGRAQFLGDAAAPLPFGQQGSLGLFYRAYRLAFPQPVVDTYYGTTISDADWTDAGYVTPTGLTGRWIPTGTSDYPAQPAAHFYLPNGATDPFGVSTTITRDRYDLLVQSVATTGAAWRTTSVVNDYRVLGPVQLTDVNGNRSAVRHDPLGFVVRSALMGKAGAGEGDTLDDPTTILEYDLTRWATVGTPNVTHVKAREKFGAANAGWRETYLYATGTGGVAVAKTQAPGGWLATGRTILNNKGNPVKQYEPYYSPIPDYDSIEALATVGVTPILHYDPLSRLIRTDLPNGTFSTVAFTGWRSVASDSNDTVLDSRWYAERGSPDPTGPEPADPEVRAAWLATKHARTPSAAHLDGLGRTILAVGDLGGGTTAVVRSKTDLTGRRTSLVDPLGREVSAGFTSMVGGPVFAKTAERGSRWMFSDIGGAPVRSWDGTGRVFRNRFDTLRRPLAISVQDGTGPQVLLSYVVYGDRKPDALARNLNGVTHQLYDGAGMVAVDSRDFAGVPGAITRVLAKNPTVQPDWTPLAAAADYAAVQTAAAALLDSADTYTASSTHDALGRALTLTLPDGTVLIPGYDRASRLDGLSVRISGAASDTVFLAQQTYDAKGQRLTSKHGNGVGLTYSYDPETFRLVDLTAAATGADPKTQALQKLHYTYDPVGNIVRLADDAQQTHFFANAVVAPEATYEYDPIYRLVTATGRELTVGNDAVRTWDDLAVSTPVPHVNDTTAVRRYTERYEYDLCGNIMTLRHVAPVTGGSWTQHYRYRYQDDATDTTNRLAATSRPGDADGGPYTQTYDYDAHGNFARLRTPTPGELTWNPLDQLQKVDLGGGGIAYYAYGADGQRLRKVIDRPGGLRQERIYLGALEIYRERRPHRRGIRGRWAGQRGARLAGHEHHRHMRARRHLHRELARLQRQRRDRLPRRGNTGPAHRVQREQRTSGQALRHRLPHHTGRLPSVHNRHSGVDGDVDLLEILRGQHLPDRHRPRQRQDGFAVPGVQRHHQERGGTGQHEQGAQQQVRDAAASFRSAQPRGGLLAVRDPGTTGRRRASVGVRLRDVGGHAGTSSGHGGSAPRRRGCSASGRTSCCLCCYDRRCCPARVSRRRCC